MIPTHLYYSSKTCANRPAHLFPMSEKDLPPLRQHLFRQNLLFHGRTFSQSFRNPGFIKIALCKSILHNAIKFILCSTPFLVFLIFSFFFRIPKYPVFLYFAPFTKHFFIAALPLARDLRYLSVEKIYALLIPDHKKKEGII